MWSDVVTSAWEHEQKRQTLVSLADVGFKAPGEMRAEGEGYWTGRTDNSATGMRDLTPPLPDVDCWDPWDYLDWER